MATTHLELYDKRTDRRTVFHSLLLTPSARILAPPVHRSSTQVSLPTSTSSRLSRLLVRRLLRRCLRRCICRHLPDLAEAVRRDRRGGRLTQDRRHVELSATPRVEGNGADIPPDRAADLRQRQDVQLLLIEADRGGERLFNEVTDLEDSKQCPRDHRHDKQGSPTEHVHQCERSVPVGREAREQRVSAVCVSGGPFNIAGSIHVVGTVIV
jgi:hypothetical protein